MNMNNIEIGVTLTVCPDPDYHYEIEVSDMLSVKCIKHLTDTVSVVSFGSAEEMRAVANAMIVALGVMK
jgi:hypothetical protein